jgi:hypothetical protein
MESKKLRDVKKGEFFRLRESETAPVWIKTGGWMRKGGKTKYECDQYEDCGRCNFYSADRVVFVGFTY